LGSNFDKKWVGTIFVNSSGHPDLCRAHGFRRQEIGITANCSKKFPSSVTRCFVKKVAQFCPNIAQNGALVNKNFCPKEFLVKIWKSHNKK
jgi:hypothetical protein